ncbi:unnamed protein product [Echinostoma caproni]|uniref:Secreted protein n=1 Tax=Echinostoma caproni TaxID=27848 RepID=A0A183AUX3_9TREM|nr:unnamed protein product [Echinostoma caproni]
MNCTTVWVEIALAGSLFHTLATVWEKKFALMLLRALGLLNFNLLLLSMLSIEAPVLVISLGASMPQ